MAMFQRVLPVRALPAPDAPTTQVRRCTFRRVTAVERRRGTPVYDVACLYPKRETPIPLGDPASAWPICGACTAEGIFRPDED
jgi:hypothetical protein